MKTDGPFHVRLRWTQMATEFDFRVSCAPPLARLAEQVLEDCRARAARLERELSEFLPQSPVYQLNHAPVGERVRFSRAGIELLERSARLEALTDGAFDVLAKSASRAGASLRDNLRWDLQSGEVSRLIDGLHLGFGAIGKGFALDECRALVERQGFRDFLFSAGGSSIIVSGHAAPGEPWQFGWSWRKDPDGCPLGLRLSHASGDPVAIGVSGTQEQGAHIRARPGQAPSPVLSSLIGHASASEADALSTALFVAGMERARSWDFLTAPAAAVIDHAEIPSWNGLFQKFWGPLSMIALAAFLPGLASIARAADGADTEIDLGASLGAHDFNPYLLERHGAWILLPLFALLLVMLHLKKPKKKSETLMKSKVRPKAPSLLSLLAIAALWTKLEQAQAVEFEKSAHALIDVLGTPKAHKKVFPGVNGDTTAFFAKDAAGKATQVAFVEHGLYPPNCTHTWVIGIQAASGKVTQVRPIEMQCPHAFPTRSASFLDQFKGAGPADVAKLDSSVQAVAKATGTSKLATEAVKRSIQNFQKIKGTL